MIKKILITIMSSLSLCAFAQDSMLNSTNRNYAMSANSLYMLTLSLLNGTGQFEVMEMQSKSGYILFRTGQQGYIATISEVSKNESNIKILPTNSSSINALDIQNSIFQLLNDNLYNIPKQVL